MKTRNKKAFTVVELVIVIAIIAILAAILIPTFASLVKKANVSADTQLIRNLNTALASDSAANNNKPHPTMTDALKAAEDFGYDVGKINKSATDNEILWDSANDLFCYYDAATNKVKYIPESESKITKTLTADSCEYWCIISVEAENRDAPVDVDCGKEDKNWSVFFKECNAKNINAKTGVDVGWINTVESINYERTSTDPEQLVKIRSYGGKVTVDAPNDTVEHYGFATELRCENVKVGTFREFGTVGRLIYRDNDGKIEFGSTAVVYCYMNASDDANQNIDNVRAFNGVAEGAIIYTTIANTVLDTDVDDRFRDTVFSGKGVVVEGHLVDVAKCYNHLNDYDLIHIGDDIYVICKCCGGFTRYIGSNGEYTVADNSTIPAPTDEFDDSGKTFPSLDPSVEGPCKHTNLDHYKKVDETCTEDGTIEYWKCARCGAMFDNENGTGIPLKDTDIIIEKKHDLIGTFCNRCGHPVAFVKQISDFTPKDEHVFDDSGNRRTISIYAIENILGMSGELGRLYLDVAYSFDSFPPNNTGLDNETKYVITFDEGKFKATASTDSSGYTAQDIYDYFSQWYVDYYVSFDAPVRAYTCGLGGSYNEWYEGAAVGFLAPDVGAEDGLIPANTDIPLLGYMLGGESNWTYRQITDIVQVFKCGFFNLSSENNKKEFTVKLRMINPNKDVDDNMETVKYYHDDALELDLPGFIDVAVAHYTITEPSGENMELLASFLKANPQIEAYLTSGNN